MIAALRTLLPLATFAIASVAVTEAHSATERHDAAQVALVSIQGEPTVEAQRQWSVDNSEPSKPAPATKEPGLHSTLALLSDQTAKALFGSTISKAYYIIEALLSNDSSSGIAVTGLELHPADGDPIQLTPARLIALQMSHNGKLTSGLIKTIVPNSSGVRTWLFVEKSRLGVLDGKLPTGNAALRRS